MLPLLLAVVVVAGQEPAVPLPGIAVERRFAEKFGVAVGDTVSVTPAPDQSPARYRIEAIYLPRPDPATALRGEYQVRFHLPDLARSLGYPDRVDRIGVAARPGVSADSVVVRLDQLAFGYRAYPSAAIAAESSSTFAVVSRFHRAIGLIAIVASAIFLLCIMLLKVEERRLDAAVMRMIGISAATVQRAFVLEAAFVAVIGSGAGVVLAYVAGALTNLFYRRRFETSLVFSYLTADIVLLGVGLSLVLGMLAGFLASRRLARARPLDLWRRAG